MPKESEWSLKDVTPDKNAPVKDWQFFRSLMQIKRILKDNELSVADVAKAIGMKVHTFRNYIYAPITSRKPLPAADKMLMLYEKFGYDFFYVITGGRETEKEKDYKKLIASYKKEISQLKEELTKKNGVIEFLKSQSNQVEE